MPSERPSPLAHVRAHGVQPAMRNWRLGAHRRGMTPELRTYIREHRGLIMRELVSEAMGIPVAFVPPPEETDAEMYLREAAWLAEFRPELWADDPAWWEAFERHRRKGLPMERAAERAREETSA